MRRALTILLLFTAVTGSAERFRKGAPATTNNDDSCDVSLQPAATLLLPYFEVRLTDGPRRTTLFSITNVTREPQIARVTLWTNLAYPALTFNIFLTGYDVQSIDLYDVLARGVIAETSSNVPPGTRSLPNHANPRFLAGAAAACAALPTTLPASVLQEAQSALSAGHVSTCGTQRIGVTHENAVGYATIDLVATCSSALPNERRYFGEELLFDNVLTGESVSVDGESTVLRPMVHLRAIPEGGAAGSTTATNLPYTFYDRLIGPLAPALARTHDRRQPLPAAFAMRWMDAAPNISTSFTIWREGANAGAGCDASTNNAANMAILDVVRFDEHENPTSYAFGGIFPFPNPPIVFPATSTTTISSGLFPPMISPGGDIGGWMYLNASNPGSEAYSASRDFRTGTGIMRGARQSQNWAGATMSVNGRFAGTLDAIAMANGCSPAPVFTGPATVPIAPGPNVTP